MVRAVYQAFVVYFLTVSIYSYAFISNADGSPADYEALGLLAFSSYLAIQSLTLLFEIRYLTTYHIAAVCGFHALTFFGLFVMNSTLAFESLMGYKVFGMVLQQPVFWLGTILTAAIAVFPVIGAQYL